MVALAAIFGALIVVGVLLEAFETVVLPRRVTRRFRFTRASTATTWAPFSALARRIRNLNRREGLLALYGPMSLLLLLALWAVGMLFGFALAAVGGRLQPSKGAGLPRSFTTDLYFSGTTLFTLGLGDVTPRASVSRVLTVLEAGLGFAFLAMVISYLPVALPGVLAPRTERFLARRARRHAAHRGRVVAPQQRSAGRQPARNPARVGTLRRRHCWRATSPIPCSDTFARSTTTSPGSRLSPPSSTPPRSARSGSTARPPARRNSPLPWRATPWWTWRRCSTRRRKNRREPRLTPESLQYLHRAVGRGRGSVCR